VWRGRDGRAVRSVPINVLPLEDQARIITRMDELLALCDDLEANLRSAENGAAKLAEAVVVSLVG
jgi:type I restriction enzyme, S subunit